MEWTTKVFDSTPPKYRGNRLTRVLDILHYRGKIHTRRHGLASRGHKTVCYLLLNRNNHYYLLRREYNPIRLTIIEKGLGTGLRAWNAIKDT